MTELYVEPLDRDRRLAELGVTYDDFTYVLERAEADVRQCTELDPRSLPGTIRWGRNTRYLREQLAGRGWVARDTVNHASVVRRDGAIGIAVATGDAMTGRTGFGTEKPRTKYAKGGVTAAFVAANRQLSLFPEDTDPRAVPTVMWLLLVRRDGRSLYAELSCPLAFERGYVTDWSERILLDRLEFPGDEGGFDDEPMLPDDLGPAPIDVVVRERPTP